MPGLQGKDTYFVELIYLVVNVTVSYLGSILNDGTGAIDISGFKSNYTNHGFQFEDIFTLTTV